MGLGPFQDGAGLSAGHMGWKVQEGRARLLLFNIPNIFQCSIAFQIVKYEKVISRDPKISKLGMLRDNFK
jgi:hypothetical protein